MKKVLIAGSGQFASNWVIHTRKLYRNFVVSKSLNSTFFEDYSVEDLSDYQKTKKLVFHIKPDVIVNAAALTNIESCEKFPEEALKANVLVPKNLSQIASELNIPLVHLSTDHFYSEPEEIRNELVKTQPVNQYGRTKILGELEILKNTENFVILRTNFFNILNGGNLGSLPKMIYDLKKRKPYSGAIDYYFNPVSVKFLIQTINEILEIGIYGILNVTSDQCISKYDFAVKVCDYINIDSKIIQKIKIKEISDLTIRPQNLCLVNDKIKNLMKIEEINVFEQLKELIIENRLVES